MKLIASALLLFTCTSLTAGDWVSPTDTKYMNRNPGLFAKFAAARSVMDGYRGRSSDLNYVGSNLQEILNQEPGFAPAYMEFGRVYISLAHTSYKNYRQKEMHIAEWAINKAIELEPEYADAHVLKGYLYTNMNRYDEAKKSLDKAKEIGTEIPWLRLNRAELLDRMGKHEEALLLYKRTVSEGTNNKTAYVAALEGLKSISTQLGRYEEANAAYIQTIEFEPESAWNWGNYAHFLLYYYKDTDGAIENGRKTLSIMNYGAARMTLASSLYTKWVALKAEGKLEEAQAHFDEASTLFPDTTSIEQRLIGFPHLRHVATELAIQSYKTNPPGVLLRDGTISSR